MPYYLRGNLWGYICRECPRPLWGVVVRAYAAEGDRLIERAVANPKTTTALVDEKEVKARAGRLLAEARVGEDGSYELVFDKKNRYQGGPVDIDLRIESLSHLDERATTASPRQVHVTTVQPSYRARDDAYVAYWEWYLPAYWWCRILSWFDLWVICGRVTICGTDKPVGGVTVEVRDADWIYDDYLGSATTDSSGRFILYYPGSAFRQGYPIGEFVDGPDVYVTIRLGTIVLLAETRARGHQPDRENVGTCFCLDLCVEDAPQISDEPIAWFSHVGGYNYTSQIHSVHPGSGLTNDAENRAFFQTMRLNGVFAKTLGGAPLEYCFEWQELDANTGASLTGWQPVQPGQIARTKIGTLQQIISSVPTPKDYTVNGNASVDAVASFNGHWIQAPQESNVLGDGYFQPNGNFINLISQSLVPFGSRPAWGALNMVNVQTGNSTTSAGAALGANRFFALRMRVRKVGTTVEFDGGTCQKIAIENRLYDNISHHPAWAGSVSSGSLGVCMLDIQELQVQGCAEIQDNLHVLVTAAHPNLGPVTLSIIGGNAAGKTLTAPTIGLPDERHGVAGMNFAATDLDPCAYIVTLFARLMLTTGDNVPSDLVDQMAFCKAPPP
jgi:hypothetical protein